MLEENEKLKGGEGVDLEAVIDSAEFAEIKDFIEDVVRDELTRRINAAHPKWDLSFLTDSGVDPKSSEINRDDGIAGEKGAEVDPIEGGKMGGRSRVGRGQCDDHWKFKFVIDDAKFCFYFRTNTSYFFFATF